MLKVVIFQHFRHAVGPEVDDVNGSGVVARSPQGARYFPTSAFSAAGVFEQQTLRTGSEEIAAKSGGVECHEASINIANLYLCNNHPTICLCMAY